METYEFQAESRHLLDMMIHSIYTQKEIFLRELISNASDALDKLHYLSLSGTDMGIDKADMEIRIRINKEKRLVRIRDNGIGMNAEELTKNLGTIARSGSDSFKKLMKTDSLIGQFGVGFYSAFMVADKVTVLSKKFGENTGWRWDSDGVDSFTVQPYDKKSVGTDVILHIRQEETPGADEYDCYLREYTYYKLVKKYSDYIRYPIKLYMPHPEIKEGSDPSKPEFEEQYSYETLNSMVPIWLRSKSEQKEEDKIAFYKEHFGENTDPQKIISADVEGDVSFKAMLYIPGKQPEDYGTDSFKPGLELYSSSVKIMDSCLGLLPEEFNFIRGVVDSPDVSLNISRELLQKDKKINVISNNLSKRVRNLLLKMLKDEREEYEKFHKNFGHHLKVCAMDDYGKKKDTLGELLLFMSGKTGKLITLDEYVADMKPEQKYIYYADGNSPEAISKIPQIEIVREKDMDVLYFLDKADQFVAGMFGNYKSKKFRSVLDKDPELSPEGEKADSGANAEGGSELVAFIKEHLAGKVDDVILSNRLRSHPVCMSNGGGITYEMERYFRSLSPDMPMKAKLILEINGEHSALKALDEARKNDPDRAGKYCEILYNQARMIAGMPVEDPSGYTDLICGLWS